MIKNIPHSSGVYKMKNAEGKIIYIGKAKDLRNRVSQYFQEDPSRGARLNKMISEIKNVEYIETPTELEAVFLETNLIKKLRPKYNIKMRDDKNFIYIRINTHEDFPKISLMRKPLKDKALYLGPKTAAHKVKTTFRVLKKILPFRHCNLIIEYCGGTGENSVKISNKTIKYPCLDYHIKKCPAPCIGKCTKEQYRANIDKIIKFFKGNSSELISELKQEMKNAALDHKFEKAASLRDKMKNVEEIMSRQHISNLPFTDADAMNYVIDNGKIYTNLFQIREGKIIGQENFIFETGTIKADEAPNAAEITEAFIKFYYEQTSSIPREILLPAEPEDKNLTEKWLEKLAKTKDVASGTIKITVPQTSNRILELSLLNARSFVNQSRARWMHEHGIEEGLEELKEALRLPRLPHRIECYDISHLAGTETVGSMIVFTNGAANSNHYRKFKLAQTSPDDYASMEELLERRLQKLSREKLPTGFTLRKALKKHSTQIEENIKIAGLIVENPNYKNFFVMEKRKKFAGMIGLVKRKNVHMITGLWVNPEFRGQKLSYYLLKKAVSKTPSSRVYLICRKVLKEHYEEFGFEEIKHLPEDLHNIKNCTTTCPIEGMLSFVYDKKKHAPDKSFTSKPDLILLDGGAGQLSVGTVVLNKLQLKIPIATLAKQEEEIYAPFSKTSLKLSQESHGLQILKRMRDEAHRFAITFMKSRHGKETIASALTTIPGIAEKTMQKLFRSFGSLENIKNTPMDKIAEVAGKSTAIKIKQYFQSPPA